MSIKKSPEINKNVLDDLWQDWDYETLEQRYYEIKRAESSFSELLDHFLQNRQDF